MGGGFEGQFTAVAGTTGDAAGDAATNGRAVTGGMKVGDVRSRAPQPVKTNTATTSAAIRRSTKGMMAVVGLRSASGRRIVRRWMVATANQT
ncbi:MAG: hypothetical protein AUH44_01600 [Chloroflexi bacterium 13_1_40CM_68_15]|nr:MAG: hypothetical protein AUH44_01600 [Chloroflexi bacterium 13_1_40CM_68_15]